MFTEFPSDVVTSAVAVPTAGGFCEACTLLGNGTRCARCPRSTLNPQSEFDKWYGFWLEDNGNLINILLNGEVRHPYIRTLKPFIRETGPYDKIRCGNHYMNDLISHRDYIHWDKMSIHKRGRDPITWQRISFQPNMENMMSAMDAGARGFTVQPLGTAVPRHQLPDNLKAEIDTLPPIATLSLSASDTLTIPAKPKEVIKEVKSVLKFDAKAGVGLGLQFSGEGWSVTEIHPVPGQGGLEVGDIIIEIKGKTLVGISHTDQVKIFKENCADGVEITVKRKSFEQPPPTAQTAGAATGGDKKGMTMGPWW